MSIPRDIARKVLLESGNKRTRTEDNVGAELTGEQQTERIINISAEKAVVDKINQHAATPSIRKGPSRKRQEPSGSTIHLAREVTTPAGGKKRYKLNEETEVKDARSRSVSVPVQRYSKIRRANDPEETSESAPIVEEHFVAPPRPAKKRNRRGKVPTVDIIRLQMLENHLASSSIPYNAGFTDGRAATYRVPEPEPVQAPAINPVPVGNYVDEQTGLPDTSQSQARQEVAEIANAVKANAGSLSEQEKKELEKIVENIILKTMGTEHLAESQHRENHTINPRSDNPDAMVIQRAAVAEPVQESREKMDQLTEEVVDSHSGKKRKRGKQVGEAEGEGSSSSSASGSGPAPMDVDPSEPTSTATIEDEPVAMETEPVLEDPGREIARKAAEARAETERKKLNEKVPMAQDFDDLTQSERNKIVREEALQRERELRERAYQEHVQNRPDEEMAEYEHKTKSLREALQALRDETQPQLPGESVVGDASLSTGRVPQTIVGNQIKKMNLIGEKRVLEGPLSEEDVRRARGGEDKRMYPGNESIPAGAAFAGQFPGFDPASMSLVIQKELLPFGNFSFWRGLPHNPLNPQGKPISKRNRGNINQLRKAGYFAYDHTESSWARIMKNQLPSQRRDGSYLEALRIAKTKKLQRTRREEDEKEKQRLEEKKAKKQKVGEEGAPAAGAGVFVKADQKAAAETRWVEHMEEQNAANTSTPIPKPGLSRASAMAYQEHLDKGGASASATHDNRKIDFGPGSKRL